MSIQRASKNRKKILIPGGTGFIGYHLSLFLSKKGWIVHSLSKSKPKNSRRVYNVKYIYCDIRNKNNLKKKLDNYVTNVRTPFAGRTPGGALPLPLLLGRGPAAWPSTQSCGPCCVRA